MPREIRDVVFVDGVRTPFGKAGEKGMYAETRADDLVVTVHPGAAAAQPGAAAGAGRRGRHRGHHPDRRPGPDHRPHRRAPGRPAEVRARLRDRPDVRRRDDRGHHDRRRHRLRRLRRRDRRRRRAHGPPPDGRGRRPEPAFVAEKLVDPSALVMGATAENLHDRFPHLTKERADAFAACAARRSSPRRTPTARSSPTWSRSRPASAEQGWGLATTRRAAAPRAPRWRASPTLKTPFRPHGRVTAGNAAGLNDGATACLLAVGRRRRGARPAGQDAAGRASPSPASSPRSWASARSRRPRRRSRKAGLTIDDIGLFELNEAFAVQVLAFLDHFGIADDDPRVNP